MSAARQAFGEVGERIAERWLRQRGWRVLQRRFRNGHRDIDLVVERDGMVAFVEVKARAGTSSAIRSRRSTGGSSGSWRGRRRSGSTGIGRPRTSVSLRRGRGTGGRATGCGSGTSRTPSRLRRIGLISGADLRILFGYRDRSRFAGTITPRGQSESHDSTRGCDEWLFPRCRTTRRRR